MVAIGDDGEELGRLLGADRPTGTAVAGLAGNLRESGGEGVDLPLDPSRVVVARNISGEGGGVELVFGEPDPDREAVAGIAGSDRDFDLAENLTGVDEATPTP